VLHLVLQAYQEEVDLALHLLLQDLQAHQVYQAEVVQVLLQHLQVLQEHLLLLVHQEPRV
jgi:hypothetical protein